MKGKHHILLETNRIRYEFDLSRNISVIMGDSATGKTTLIELLQAYARNGSASGITLLSDVPCTVYSGTNDDWPSFFEKDHNRIVFVDEDYPFIHSNAFAETIQGSSDYYVFITRKPLVNLPYSTKAIYGIRTSGKYHFPEKIYQEFYPIYEDRKNALLSRLEDPLTILVEDSKSGLQFYEKINQRIHCISAEGNANIYRKMLEMHKGEKVLVIADGAAFGAFIESVVSLSEVTDDIALYFPECFEWLILKSGIIKDQGIRQILETPEAYIESAEYFSWEQFFSDLLIEKTKLAGHQKYQKNHLPAYYTNARNTGLILNVFPESIRKLLT